MSLTKILFIISSLSYRSTAAATLCCVSASLAMAQSPVSAQQLSGEVTDEKGRPIEAAVVMARKQGIMAMTDAKGCFVLPSNKGEKMVEITVECLGYAAQTLTVDMSKRPSLRITLKEDNLKLDEVVVTARRSTESSTTTYDIGRMAMDNQQMVNLADLSQLLPGGKTVNASLISDSRVSLRAGSSEMGNAAFGTAIEIDGVRLGNNAAAGETTSASTRAVSSAAIAGVETIPGVSSVEYGDMSNGVVRVRSRRGRSPFIFEGKVNQHTRQVALSKGFGLGGGVMNVTMEHARSLSDAASPHTAYQRNAITMTYQRSLLTQWMPLTMEATTAINLGGYDSKADPDRELESYQKVRDNSFRGSLRLRWQPARAWLTGLEARLSANYADRLQTNNDYTSSSSTQPYIHATDEGYHIARLYADDPAASITLGPTGYWYVKHFSDSKPLDLSAKLKATWHHHLGPLSSHTKAGLDYTWSHNSGEGITYSDPLTRPTHRYYRYSELPALRSLGLYAEEQLAMALPHNQKAELTAGLRADRTMIHGSAYSATANYSPRFKGRHIVVEHGRGWLKSLSWHAGWGKSVKLPSFQVLYPRESYADHLAFASPTTADGTSFYAYHTYPSTAQRNSDLRHQYTLQTDLGLQLNLLGTRISLSYYRHDTRHSYMATSVYTPFAYRFTSPAEAQQSAIPSNRRVYDIDQHSGLVTISDAEGLLPAEQLAATERRTYLSTTRYVNASPTKREGLEWVVDFPQIAPLRTQLRIDGNFYSYRGLDETLFADVPVSLSSTGSDGQPFAYIGYYRGANATSASYTANASVSNGGEARQVNLNATITTHIPRLRLIMALRVESSLYRYSRALSAYSDATRGYVASDDNSNFGEAYDGTSVDKRIIVYPEYYATWDNPTELLPFAERYAWARDNDRALYNDLTQLVVRSNYPYTMNPNRLSRYCSANFSVTKEIGDHVQVSFYANNFVNTLRRVHSSQTDLETSLFASGYVPSYYYGLALKLKL